MASRLRSKPKYLPGHKVAQNDEETRKQRKGCQVKKRWQSEAEATQWLLDYARSSSISKATRLQSDEGTRKQRKGCRVKKRFREVKGLPSGAEETQWLLGYARSPSISKDTRLQRDEGTPKQKKDCRVKKGWPSEEKVAERSRGNTIAPRLRSKL